MNSQLDGASASKYRSRLQQSGLKMPLETKQAATPEAISWAQSAHKRMVASRHERISIVAYSMAEARGFEPGHDAEYWFHAQKVIDAQDAGT